MKRNIILYIVRLSFFMINIFPLYAKEYLCPKTPIKIRVGETINKNWFIWSLNEDLSYLNKAYYKVFNNTYSFDYWFSFTSGRDNTKGKEPSYFIACCGWLSKEKKNICAYKYVNENNCDSVSRRIPRMKFICPEKHENNE